jgi:hypothetical protein
MKLEQKLKTIKMRTKKITVATLQLLGALALAAAGAATHVHAAPAQIQFTGSYISSWQGNNPANDKEYEGFQDSMARDSDLDGFDSSVLAAHKRDDWSTGAIHVLGHNPLAGTSEEPEASPSFLDARLLITLSDSDMSKRNETPPFCNPDMTARQTSKGVLNMPVNRVRLKNAMRGTLSGSKVNNTAYTQYLSSSVPEVSSLCLLALGAGGLLTYRCRKHSA